MTKHIPLIEEDFTPHKSFGCHEEYPYLYVWHEDQTELKIYDLRKESKKPLRIGDYNSDIIISKKGAPK